MIDFNQVKTSGLDLIANVVAIENKAQRKRYLLEFRFQSILEVDKQTLFLFFNILQKEPIEVEPIFDGPDIVFRFYADAVKVSALGKHRSSDSILLVAL